LTSLSRLVDRGGEHQGVSWVAAEGQFRCLKSITYFLRIYFRLGIRFRPETKRTKEREMSGKYEKASLAVPFDPAASYASCSMHDMYIFPTLTPISHGSPSPFPLPSCPTVTTTSYKPHVSPPCPSASLETLTLCSYATHIPLPEIRYAPPLHHGWTAGSKDIQQPLTTGCVTSGVG
jgi:hypothetical protein